MLLKLDSILHRQQHINKTDSSVMRCFHTGSTERTSTFIFIYVYAVDSVFAVHMSMCISSQIYVCIDNNFVADDWNGRVAVLQLTHFTPYTHMGKQSGMRGMNKKKPYSSINDTNIIAYWKSETHKNWCGCGQTKSINSIQLTSNVGLIRRFVCISSNLQQRIALSELATRPNNSQFYYIELHLTDLLWNWFVAPRIDG